jgi:hypothetical protein
VRQNAKELARDFDRVPTWGKRDDLRALLAKNQPPTIALAAIAAGAIVGAPANAWSSK